MTLKSCQFKLENIYNFTKKIFSIKDSSIDEQVHIEMLSIATNWICNIQCEICDIWKIKDKTLISPPLLKSSLQSTFFDNVACVAFFGGEPTLHPELPELMKNVRERFGFDAAMVTNGYGKHIPGVFDKLKNLNPLICVSIDGQKKIHDKRRGIEGVYDDALRTLSLANKLFTQKPRISFTVLPNTINELPHIFELAKEFNTDISMRAGTSGSYFGGKADDTWNENEIDELEMQISSLSDDFLANPAFIRSIPEFLRTKREIVQCKAAYVTIIVDPDLKARICHSLEPICNLAEVPLKWGKDMKWKKARKGNCFKRECFIDGPYSTSF